MYKGFNMRNDLVGFDGPEADFFWWSYDRYKQRGKHDPEWYRPQPAPVRVTEDEVNLLLPVLGYETRRRGRSNHTQYTPRATVDKDQRARDNQWIGHLGQWAAWKYFEKSIEAYVDYQRQVQARGHDNHQDLGFDTVRPNDVKVRRRKPEFQRDLRHDLIIDPRDKQPNAFYLFGLVDEHVSWENGLTITFIGWATNKLLRECRRGHLTGKWLCRGYDMYGFDPHFLRKSLWPSTS